MKSSIAFDTAAIVVNYNGWRETLLCVTSLLAATPAPAVIFIVDNGSPDDSFSHICQWGHGTQFPLLPDDHPIRQKVPLPSNPPPFHFYQETKELSPSTLAALSVPIVIAIRVSENRGYAAGVNVGLKAALRFSKLHWFWILNHDVVVAPDALAALNHCTQTQPKVELWGSKLLAFEQPETIQTIGGRYRPCLGYPTHIGAGEVDRGQYDRPISMDYVVGAAMWVHRQFVETVGLLDEAYFLYFEELDWITRARRKGKAFGYCWKSRVYHQEGHVTGGKDAQQKSEISDFYLIRNRLIFTRRYYPWCLPLVYLSFVGVIIRRIFRRQWHRIPKILKILVTHEV